MWFLYDLVEINSWHNISYSFIWRFDNYSKNVIIRQFRINDDERFQYAISIVVFVLMMSWRFQYVIIIVVRKIDIFENTIFQLFFRWKWRLFQRKLFFVFDLSVKFTRELRFLYRLNTKCECELTIKKYRLTNQHAKKMLTKCFAIRRNFEIWTNMIVYNSRKNTNFFDSKRADASKRTRQLKINKLTRLNVLMKWVKFSTTRKWFE